MRISSTWNVVFSIFLDHFGQFFSSNYYLKEKQWMKKVTQSLSSSIPLFSNRVATTLTTVRHSPKITVIIVWKLCLRREETHAYLKRTPKMVFRLSFPPLMSFSFILLS